MTCVFCEIVAGRAPARFVFDQGKAAVVAFEPLNPVTPGHVLWVPKSHVADAAELPGITAAVFGYAARYAAEQGRPFNLITSAGAAATQTVSHLHVHYVPRAAGDGLPLPWSPQQKRRRPCPSCTGDRTGQPMDLCSTHRAAYEAWIVAGEPDSRPGPIASTPVTDDPAVHGPDGYLSTACLHGRHDYCSAMTGYQGAKRPARCKFCSASCRCPCHTAESPQVRPTEGTKIVTD